MIVIVGMLVVLFSVVTGYVEHGGNLWVLFQPSEYLIIGGAALGAMLVGTPTAAVKMLWKQVSGITKGGTTKQDYVELLTMLYNLFRTAQQSGVMALEAHAEEPQKSSILSAYPKFLASHGASAFLCDSLKVMIMGGVAPHDFDDLMDHDIETHHHDVVQPANALARMADALPGLGIVAAVLGVVITMGKIDGPPSELGESVAVALVGTFLGVFGAYGFVGPMAASLEAKAAASTKYFECMKTALLAFQKGLPPAIAIEFARRVLPDEVRPGFTETEKACKGARHGATVAAAA
jgi:chemotaxis protein MotA